MNNEHIIQINYGGRSSSAPRQPQPQPQPQSQSPQLQPQRQHPPSFGRRESSLEEIGDRLVSMLDEIEKRVENLRETAALMEQEKESLIEMLNTVQMNKDMLRLSV